MRRLLIIEIMNIFIIPVFFNILLVLHCPEGYRDKEVRGTQTAVDTFIDIVAYTDEYVLRFLFQSFMIILFFQWRSDPLTIYSSFRTSIMQGRNKFNHFLYDIGLRNVLAVTVFTLGLSCSVLIPLVTPLCALLFFTTYAIDKYNLFFVY